MLLQFSIILEQSNFKFQSRCWQLSRKNLEIWRPSSHKRRTLSSFCRRRVLLRASSRQKSLKPSAQFSTGKVERRALSLKTRDQMTSRLLRRMPRIETCKSQHLRLILSMLKESSFSCTTSKQPRQYLDKICQTSLELAVCRTVFKARIISQWIRRKVSLCTLSILRFVTKADWPQTKTWTLPASLVKCRTEH